MNHIEVVAAIFICDGKVLCMQRGPGKYEYISYKYEFPGGKINPGENKYDAFVREIKEEMNLEVPKEDVKYFLMVNHQYPDFYITMHSFIVDLKDKNFERKEHINHRWVYPDELSDLDWVQADIPIIEKILAEGENLC